MMIRTLYPRKQGMYGKSPPLPEEIYLKGVLQQLYSFCVFRSVALPRFSKGEGQPLAAVFVHLDVCLRPPCPSLLFKKETTGMLRGTGASRRTSAATISIPSAPCRASRSRSCDAHLSGRWRTWLRGR